MRTGPGLATWLAVLAVACGGASAAPPKALGPPPTAAPDRIPLEIRLPEGARGPVPVTVGVPLPSEGLAGAWTVAGPSGPVATQRRVSANFSEGRPSWWLVDFQAQPGAAYALVPQKSPAPKRSVRVEPTKDGGATVDTGAGQWTIPPDARLLAKVLGADGKARLEAAGWGGSASKVAAKVEIVERGPLRAMVRVRAQEAVAGLDLSARLHFYAGMPYARARITLTNHARCLFGSEAPGASNGDCPSEGHLPVCESLDSPNVRVVEDISWRLAPAGAAGAKPAPEEVLYQDSSGTDAWDHYKGRGPRMQSAVRFRGYQRTRAGKVVDTGSAAEGVMQTGGVRVEVPRFAEEFPKALRVRGGGVEVGLFPGEFGAAHRFRAGEQKTHDVWISLDPVNAVPTDVRAWPDVRWLWRTHGLGYLAPRVDGAFADYERYLDDQHNRSAWGDGQCSNAAGRCAPSLADARRMWDFHGWTDYGDVPTDFEVPTSPYGLKYDLLLGLVHQAVRTGRADWWEMARAGALHTADIDILHGRHRGIDAARGWHEGGVWGHSRHDETGITNPHRNCAHPAPDTYWGVVGMTGWGLLTGDDVVREAAIELADNTAWRLRNSGNTPCLAQATGVQGEGSGWLLFDENPRAAANTQRILVWAWRLTGDARYLEEAGRMVRWAACAQPRLTCGGWPVALLTRSVGEYALAARDARVKAEPATDGVMRHLLGALSGDFSTSGGRGWFTGCGFGDHVNAWMFLGADAFALGYAVTGDRRWLDAFGLPSFRTAAADPHFPGDGSQYHSSKELAGALGGGSTFLHFFHGGRP
jgi:hypothetical protein